MTTADRTHEQGHKPPQAGEAARLARRYALALYALAEERRVVDTVAADMRGMLTLLAESVTFRALIADPRVTAAQMTVALQAMAQKAGLNILSANLLGLIARNRRAALTPQIAAAYLDERARRAGEVLAEVTVARPLSVQQQQILTQHLTAAADGGKVTLAIREDAALIGGFVVKLGSRLIDASIQGKLASLARHLREAA